MIKQASLFFTLMVTAFAVEASCFDYWYYTDSQRFIKSPVKRDNLGHFSGKKARQCLHGNTNRAPSYLSKYEYRHYVAVAAEAEGIDPNIVLSVIKAESAFNTNAVSHKGAKGLMQLMDATAQELGVTDSFDPRQNINAGTALLARLMKKYSSLDLALAAYNAGEGVVDKKGIPNYKETKSYIKKVKGYLNDLS